MTTRTIRSFNEYTPKQFVNGGQQWEKRYDHGGVALTVVYKNRITRQDVRHAFDDLEWEHKVLLDDSMSLLPD